MAGKYYVIEGQDGTGKSTQVEMLAVFLRKLGKQVVTMHEPDGDLPSAKLLRTIIKDKQYDLDPHTYVLLLTAARNELWRKLAEPCLAEDGIVISARNWWSTLAYQGYGQGIDLDLIRYTTTSYLPARYLTPDYSVILTLDERERIRRLADRDANSSKDAFESKSDEFQNIVTNSYLDIADEQGVLTLDASPPALEVHKRILSLFDLTP